VIPGRTTNDRTSDIRRGADRGRGAALHAPAASASGPEDTESAGEIGI
jgi:hypothetical protein